MSAPIGGTKTLFADNFSRDGRINSTKWDFNDFDKGGSFYNGTQQRQVLPSASGGVLHLQLDTYNPPPKPIPADWNSNPPAFLGSEAISKQLFTRGETGVAFEARLKVPQTQGGIVGGFFTFAGPPASHDEIDFEAITRNFDQIQTNIYHNRGLDNGNPKYSDPVPNLLGTWHTYRIEWLPDRVRWFVDGALVRTTSDPKEVPDKAMALHLNIWGSPSNWPSGQPGFVATKDASKNQKFFFDVNSVKVEQLSTMTGGGGADALRGAARSDWINGLNGADKIYGGAGHDTGLGGAGADTLYGGAGNDALYGGRDADKLYGGSGADYLRGGYGNDLIGGGGGRDVQIGDNGADAFTFLSAANSRPGANRDVIADMNPRFGDKIDLKAIDANTRVASNQAFEFIGTREFSGNVGDAAHRGEVRYEAVKRGVLVSANSNGDKIADFEILVIGLAALKASDFVL